MARSSLRRLKSRLQLPSHTLEAECRWAGTTQMVSSSESDRNARAVKGLRNSQRLNTHGERAENPRLLTLDPGSKAPQTVRIGDPAVEGLGRLGGPEIRCKRSRVSGLTV
mmetsp:Transcript_36427/g.56902  ORF Transcript_36427/g.56902 Transcript_36427/m.56902 type:complete len:110 (-) Transcript_36427:190-519(-)